MSAVFFSLVPTNKMEEKERNPRVTFGLPLYSHSWIFTLLLIAFLSSLAQCGKC